VNLANQRSVLPPPPPLSLSLSLTFDVCLLTASTRHFMRAVWLCFRPLPISFSPSLSLSLSPLPLPPGFRFCHEQEAADEEDEKPPIEGEIDNVYSSAAVAEAATCGKYQTPAATARSCVSSNKQCLNFPPPSYCFPHFAPTV
jgi:hypothetical protein